MDTDITLKFGKRIKAIRLKKRMSQGDVAKELNVGIAYISKIERGTENMSLKNIERLARALKVPMRELIG
jgi:transcriptional regulator with XRE-family HTH domain